VKVLLHRARKKLAGDLPSQFKIDKTK